MGEEESHAEVGGVPVVVILIFGGFIAFICCTFICLTSCIGKCQEQAERAENEKNEKLWADAPVAQPPIVYQNQRKSYKLHGCF